MHINFLNINRSIKSKNNWAGEIDGEIVKYNVNIYYYFENRTVVLDKITHEINLYIYREREGMIVVQAGKIIHLTYCVFKLTTMR